MGEKTVPQNVSMPLLVPMVLDLADMPLSMYYQQLLALRDKAPVLTAFSLYKTADGEVHNYKDQTAESEDINIYFDMVYNNVSDDANRIDGIFEPKRRLK